MKSNIERELSNTKDSILNNINILETKIEEVAKETLFKQVNNHPLIMTGAFMTSGFILGNVIFNKKEASPESAPTPKESFNPNEEQVWRPGNDVLQVDEKDLKKQNTSAAWESFKKEFTPEIKLLKQIALGATLNFVHKKIKNSSPQLSSYLNEVIGGVHKNISEQTADVWPYSSEGSKL